MRCANFNKFMNLVNTVGPLTLPSTGMIRIILDHIDPFPLNWYPMRHSPPFSYPTILWDSDSEELSNVIVRMSSFHLTCAFMGALGKKMRCSGFEEVLIESGICPSGLIEQVLTGKHCNHALCVHKVVYKALERILLHVYYLQRSYPSKYKRDRTNAFITISIEVSTTNGYGCSSC